MNRLFFDGAIPLSRRDALLALGGGAACLGFLADSPAAAEKEVSLAPASIDWEKISRQFLLDPSLTYLNTGSLGSTPRPVLEARRGVEQLLESNPAGQGFGPVLAQAEATRGKVAELIGCDVNEVTVTRNTTEGMNFIAEGIDLKPGDRVLTSNNEHPGGLRAWKYLANTRKIEVDTAEIASPPGSEDEVVDSFKKAIKPETRVIMCSHVTFSSGLKVPIARLSELAHQHNCLMVVDGAQSSGGVAVDVRKLGCDAYASSGHKFLLGPKGTGILYISEQAKGQIKPMQLDDGYGYYTAIRGTNGMPEAIGLGSVIDWVKAIGHDAVFARLMSLRNALYDVLQKSPYIKIDSPLPGSPMASQLVCFRVTDRDRYKKLQEQFTKDNVVVRGIGINGIDFRLSVHLYNTEKDIARFGESLRQAMA
jgi:selenocysteine lyase/cysteine desulfurase